MFQTEPLRWLQSFQSAPLTGFFRGVTFFAEPDFLVALFMLVIFGIDRRKGLVLLLAVLWTVVFNTIIKDLVALPRPMDVDALVRPLGNDGIVLPHYINRGATSFFSALPPDIVDHYRFLHGEEFGFPSGHCSTTIATWGTLALLFRRKWLGWLAVALACTMVVSRMYLGRHFLADTLGGLVIGVIALCVLAVIVTKTCWIHTTPQGEHAPKSHLPIPGIILLVVFPAILLFLPFDIHKQAALLAGTGAGYLLGDELRTFDRIRGFWRHAALISMAIALFGLLQLIFELTITRAFPDSPVQVGILKAFLVPCLLFWGTSRVSSAILSPRELS